MRSLNERRKRVRKCLCLLTGVGWRRGWGGVGWGGVGGADEGEVESVAGKVDRLLGSVVLNACDLR